MGRRPLLRRRPHLRSHGRRTGGLRDVDVSILALEALDEASRSRADRTEIADAVAGGTEFFLRHRLFRSHRDGSIVNPAFTKLSFPPRWHYDVLRGLEQLATTDATWDDRCRDAMDVLQHRRRRDGTWPVQNKHSGRVWFDMETTGRPSRWNTLRSLRVLRWSARGCTIGPAGRE